MFQLLFHPILRLPPILSSPRARIRVSSTDLKVPTNFYANLWSRRQESTIALPAPITPSLTSRYLPKSAEYQICNTPERARSQASGALAAAAAMRITPNLLQRSSKKSLHTFHKKKLVPQFSTSLHIFSKSQICVLIRFWTQMAPYGTVGGPYGL